MKKVSLLLATGLVLAAGSLSPVLAAHRPTTLAVAQAFPTAEAAQAFGDGKRDAASWYGATNPSRADLQAEYEMATENRLSSDPDSYEYFYWQGYQMQVKYYLR